MTSETVTADASADWSPEDTEKSRRIREEYQESHDLFDLNGHIAGIDPKTGDVWLGEWLTDIVEERRQTGLHNPLWFERIGLPTALRKGGRR